MNKPEFDYQWETLSKKNKPDKNILDWSSDYGPKILSRDTENIAKEVQFNLLIENSSIKVYLVGEFNNWKKNEKYELLHDKHSLFASITLSNIKHKEKYKFLVISNEKEQFLEDPAAVYFDDLGNSIFWDFKDPSSYKQKYPFIDTFNRSTKIIQTDLPGLIVHYAKKVDPKEYYKYITESGIITKIKELGFNTIQFLPFAQSIDGSNWKYRYLIPFQFAIQKNWGNPDDFAKMIDAFHKEEIAVIGDFVLGHIPYKDFEVFGQSSQNHGIHAWKDKENNYVYLREETLWGTKRIDFDDPYVRNFFISSCIHFMKNYKIDGFRIDNVDGIIRFGENGDGDERPNGRVFLRELNLKIYTYNPAALINYEAHYYHGDNAKLLVAPINSDKRALGATAYNSSRLTYYFHNEIMFKGADEYNIWKFKYINDEKEWGKSNSTIADFHNHDAAAGIMSMRCTGAYAFNCMKHDKKVDDFHAIGKIKVMEAIISFSTEGRTLDLLQTFLLQPGTFEHDSSIRWELINNERGGGLVSYKKEINKLLDNPVFFPKNVCNRKYLNIDNINKILIIERSSETQSYIIVINLSSEPHLNYKVGVKRCNDYKLIFNSNDKKYLGLGDEYIQNTFKNMPSKSFELLDREIELISIPSYGVLVLKENK